MALSPATREKLKTVSTATLCTALFKRGLRNQYIQDVHPLDPAAAPMVGEAFTLRYIPAREDLNPISVFLDRTHPQRVATGDLGVVAEEIGTGKEAEQDQGAHEHGGRGIPRNSQRQRRDERAAAAGVVGASAATTPPSAPSP